MKNDLVNHQSSFINHQYHRSAFTLVELLVVIGIAALSLAVLFPNFMGIRSRARDTQRKRQLAEIQKALELYKLDYNPPAYPTQGALDYTSCKNPWCQNQSDCVGSPGNVYMNKVPCDPGSAMPTPFIYKQGADSLTYTLTACLENKADPDIDTDQTKHPECTNQGLVSYTLKEP